MEHPTKKVTVEQLRPGMYLHDLNYGWLDHPFLTNSFKINDLETIVRITAMGIRELYIDTNKGDDVGPAPTRDEVQADLQRRLQREGIEPSTHAAPTAREERVYAERR